MDDAITNRLNDALMAAPTAYRAELCAWVQESDLTRALKATRAAGVEVARVEVDATGKITIVTGKAPETVGEDRGGDQWDAALK